MIRQFINRYKRLRTEHFLAQTYQYSYAFVGMGQHSLTNLYPVLHYLGVPLKYICVTSERKVRQIEQKYRVKATTSLDILLNDDEVKGMFVSASPSAHFSIASQILKSGKSLFIEKPPCQSLAELDALIALQRLHASPTAMVGLQQRHGPAVQLLRERLNKEHLVSYDLQYLTGAYPEGDALLDLHIHPLDLVVHLFGRPEILTCHRVAPSSYLLMLRHPKIAGTLELSTAYSWTAAEETLKVCTNSGIYHLSQMEELSYEPIPSTIFGLPSEKIRPGKKSIECLYTRNNFTPVLPNNQIHSQGYFNEIQAFVDAVEGHRNNVVSSIETIRDTYMLIETIKPHPQPLSDKPHPQPLSEGRGE